MKNNRYILPFVALMALTACQGKLEILDKPIMHETKFGGIYIDMTIDAFNEKGFKLGDSLNVTFSNGYVLKDLPYYNGYYVDNLAPLLVGYPGYPYIKTCFNNGPDMWSIGEMEEETTVDIKLNKRGKYKDVQEAMDIHYTDEQGDIPDEVFANFRASNITNLKPNVLYRSASPIDNQHKRAAVADRLITNKVHAVMNLSDDNGEMAEHISQDDFNSPYYQSLIQSNNVIALAMNMNFQTSLDNTETQEVPGLFTDYLKETFQEKLVRGLTFLSEREAPYLVHCVEGKDRTGFVCMVMEALVGATYNEIIDDYMITYDNYYGINKQKDLNKYNVIKGKNIDVMLKTIIGDANVNIETADYEHYAEQYLLSKGMEQSAITALKNKLKAN